MIEANGVQLCCEAFGDAWLTKRVRPQLGIDTKLLASDVGRLPMWLPDAPSNLLRSIKQLSCTCLWRCLGG